MAQDSALRGENTIRLAKCTEDDELTANRELARTHGAVGDRVILVNAVSARLRAMLNEARIGASGTITNTALKDKEKGKEKALARLPNGFANNPPAWLDERAPGWALRGWPDGLPLNKAISAWSSPQLYSVLAMLLQGRITLVHPSLTDEPIRAPQDVEPPRARPRRSGSVAPSVAPESDNDESEVLGLLEPTLGDVRGTSPGGLSAGTVPTDGGSATIPPNSPRDDDMDRTTLAASASPQNSKGKGKGKGAAPAKRPVRARMKARPPAPRPPAVRVGDGTESEADSDRASPSEESEESDDEHSEEEDEEEEAEETPEPPSPAVSKSNAPSPAKSTTSAAPKRQRPADEPAADGPPAKKHRRSRSTVDAEEKARLAEEKKRLREEERQRKKEAKEAERKAKIERRIMKEAAKEAEALAKEDRERRNVEELKESRKRMSVAPSEAGSEDRETKRRKLK